MGFGVWASQPNAVAYTLGSGATSTMSRPHLLSFDVNQTGTNFYILTGNTKYEQDGGALNYMYSASFTTVDMRLLSGGNFNPGQFFKTVIVKYQAEGASVAIAGGVGSYGTLKATIRHMRIENVNKADQGGRSVLQFTAKLISPDGTTSPITWSTA